MQIDILHQLMEKLGLKKKEDISDNFYLNSKVLEKEVSYGGITIEDKSEIILTNSNKLIMKEAETQTQENDEKDKKIDELKNELVKETRKISQLTEKFENVKQEKEKLQTDYDKLTKQKEWILEYIENRFSTKKYNEILADIDNIK